MQKCLPTMCNLKMMYHAQSPPIASSTKGKSLRHPVFPGGHPSKY